MILTQQELQAVLNTNIQQTVALLNSVTTTTNPNIFDSIEASLSRIKSILSPSNNV